MSEILGCGEAFRVTFDDRETPEVCGRESLGEVFLCKSCQMTIAAQDDQE